MRILVVPKWYPWPELPVFGAFCREHARALATRHDVVVLASLATPRPSFAVYELSDGVEDGLRTIRVRYRRPRLRPFAMACQVAGMLAALRRLRSESWRPDIVHAHVYSAGPPALLLARLSRAAFVITEHYTGFQRGLVTGYDRALARLTFRRADLVAPVSEELARHLRALAPGANVRVMDNVVDTEVFAPGGPPTDASPRLLNVAALAEKKGQADLLDALARVPGATLDVVGAGPELEPLRERAERLGVGDRVRFRGELAKEEVAGLMREADLFVLPSHFENQPCVLIEAGASGLPAVATDVGGVRDLLGDSGGSIVPARDPEALASAIRAALEAPRDPERLARAARDRFGYAAFAEAWTRTYEELVKRRGTTSSAIRRESSSSE
jgi:glycosyltransferase involved in cell wall biosynthesis